MQKPDKPYKHYQMTELNMMSIRESRFLKIKPFELFFVLAPLLLAFGIFLMVTIPELDMINECVFGDDQRHCLKINR